MYIFFRLADSTLKIPEERAAKVANKIEKELFSFFRDTDSKYKNKYRSLIFNLKDPKNKVCHDISYVLGNYLKNNSCFFLEA